MRKASRIRHLRWQLERAPTHTSNVFEAQAQAKQKQLAKEKQQQDAVNSDTVAIDFQRDLLIPSYAEHRVNPTL